MSGGFMDSVHGLQVNPIVQIFFVKSAFFRDGALLPPTATWFLSWVCSTPDLSSSLELCKS